MSLDYITPIEAELDTQMHAFCHRFMTVGTRSETPRFLNLGFHQPLEPNLIYIRSTQSSIGFQVLVPYDTDLIDASEFWTQFKIYRTKFLIKHYPTIASY